MKKPWFSLFSIHKSEPAAGFVNASEKKRIAELTEQEIVLEEKAKNAVTLSDRQWYLNQKELIRWELQTYIIQRSSRTTFPSFLRIHNYFRMKYRWYYNWHLLPYAGNIHWAAMFTALGAAILFVVMFSTASPNKVMAEKKPRTLVEKDTSGIYQLKPGEKEIAGARTENFKKYQEADGSYRVAASPELHRRTRKLRVNLLKSTISGLIIKARWRSSNNKRRFGNMSPSQQFQF